MVAYNSLNMPPNPIPRVAAIHDLSGYGRSSLTVVLPVLSSMGINVCPLPTALLSSQTSGFDNYFFEDLSEQMEKIVAHWKSLPLRFDSIYSGFLGSPRQINIVKDLIKHFETDNQIITIDPVMGDEGEFYGPLDQKMIEGMRDLCSLATLITPNYTEACFLLGREYTPRISLKESIQMLKDLSALGPEKTIITSLPLEGECQSNTVLALEKKHQRVWKVQTPHIPVSYPGTGDMFASVITGRLLLKDSLPAAIDRAVNFIIHSIRNTFGHNTPQREGVLLEKSLYQLMSPENMSLCELVTLP